MATADQISKLRLFINEPSDVAPFDDVTLDQAINESMGDVQLAASRMWQLKASNYAELVDVQEGSSRRSLGSLQGNAIKMAQYYEGMSEEASGASRGPRAGTRAIERP